MLIYWADFILTPALSASFRREFASFPNFDFAIQVRFFLFQFGGLLVLFFFLLLWLEPNAFLFFWAQEISSLDKILGRNTFCYFSTFFNTYTHTGSVSRKMCVEGVLVSFVVRCWAFFLEKCFYTFLTVGINADAHWISISFPRTVVY